MDAVANYRVKPFSERDVHTFLLFVHGMNLLDRGFLDDVVKLLAASVNSQNQKGLWVLQDIAKETHRKDLDSTVSKLKAQWVGYELDSFKLNALALKYDALTMELSELIPLVKQNLYDEQPLPEDNNEYFAQLLEDAKDLMNNANTLKWGDYKPWDEKKVSTSMVYEAAIKLYLASVHRNNTEGLTKVENYLKRNENPELSAMLNELKIPAAGEVVEPTIEQKSEDDNEMMLEMEKHEYNLSRFLLAQELDYETALMEILDGVKESHWIWYIFPQLKGLGHSYNSRFYGLDDRGEAKAYLNHPVLGARLREISRALLQHHKKSIYDIMGSSIDVLKLKTCMKLFDSISPNDVFDEVLDTFFMNEI